MTQAPLPPVFDPSNEPYLGRTLLHQFDTLICACLEQSGRTARYTRSIHPSDMQAAACQLIPQSISVALSIRELVRQGHLFGALVLIRPLAERIVILLYLQLNPDAIEIWKRGWRHNEAPGFARMLAQIFEASGPDNFPFSPHDVTSIHNSVIHGKPDSADYTLIGLGDGSVGHSPSKILNNGKLCDDICVEVVGCLALAQAMMGAYFPEAPSADPGASPDAARA